MTHMGDLIDRSAKAVAAAETRLTAAEARAVRIAAGHGMPTTLQERIESHALVRSAVRKLRVIEAGGSDG